MNRKKIKKNRFLLLAILLIVCISVVVFVIEKEAVYAKHTLPGIETIAMNNGDYDPYIILEVVADKADASLGYLIGGEEPIKNGKSIKDYSSEGERNAEFLDESMTYSVPDAYNNLVGNAFEFSDFLSSGDRTVDVKGHYISAIPVGTGDYNFEEESAEYIPYDITTVPPTTEQTYDKGAAFIDDEVGSYIPTFTFFDSLLPSITIDGIEYRNYCKYELHEDNSEVVLNDESDLSLYNGEFIFDKTSSIDYVYIGEVITQSVEGEPNAYILGADGVKYLFVKTGKTAPDGYVNMLDPTIKYQMLSFQLNTEGGGEYFISSFLLATENMTKYSFEEVYLPATVGYGAFLLGTEASSTYDYVPGTGKFNWETDYSKETYDTYAYGGGFVNYEWFKKNVFDREDTEIDDLVVDVKTVTMEEFNSYNLDDVDMVYFAGISAGYSNSVSDSVDLSVDQARNLFTLLKDSNFPILMNRSVHDFVTKNAESYPNMNKLELLLTQENYDVIDISSADFLNWTTGTYWDDISKTVRAIDTNFGYNYVNQAFYMYDDTQYDEDLDAVPYVNKDFLNFFSDEMVTQGFQAVLDEIISENFYIVNAGYDDDLLDEEVTKAAALRYIINYGYKRNVIKDSISVLEIEPCYSYKYSVDNDNLDGDLNTVTTLKEAASDVTNNTGRNDFENVEIDRFLLSKEYIAENWATQFINNVDEISLTPTYTGEFIGKIEDLNETYDLIYFGLDTSTMNTVLQKNSDGKYTKTDQTLYNNSALNGLIYLHSGDYLYTTDVKLRGLLYPEDIQSEEDSDDYGKYALSGNDITLEKYNELCEYMDAGYPIVFADGFYNLDTTGMATSVNTNKIDEVSYMYKVAEYALDQGYFGNNVNVDQNIKNDLTGSEAKETLAKYLNISKLSIELVSGPELYDGTLFDPDYLEKTASGDYVLEYRFRLKDDSAVIDASTNYNVKLYIDTSVDGRFYPDEEILEVKIYEIKGEDRVQVVQKNGEFELVAGSYYELIREVPTGYVGVLPWKLLFLRNDNALVRKSISGYTAVATPTGSREPIEVLQLMSADVAKNNWKLQTNSAFQGLLTQVQDFDINITSLSVSTYILAGSESNSDEHYAKLNKYDMIVMGFADMYSFTAPETDGRDSDKLQANAALAIRDYISDGRSVLFTHDTTSFYNYSDSEWGYVFNRYVRDVVGMDRYGVMRKVPGLSLVETLYDTMWKARMLQEDGITYQYTQGYNNQTIVQYAAGGDYVYTTRPEVAEKSGQYGDEMYVTKTNEGQITRYPFDIPERFQVTNTHRQYYQLNLDTDSKDDIKNDDIVVWYCISDVASTTTDTVDIYETCPNDARNNYYIYNKGNVTYSGVGHSTVEDTMVTEMKLFVNTMVAAYNAGSHPPKVTYKDGGNEDANVIEYMYLPYDEAISEYVDKTADIYFEISDISFTQGTKAITANYYLEVSSEAEATIVEKVDGKERYLLEFTPDVVTNVITGGELENDAVHLLENEASYKFVLTAEELSLLNKNRANVYIGVKTTYTKLSGATLETKVGYYSVSILKAQLFDLE